MRTEKYSESCNKIIRRSEEERAYLWNWIILSDARERATAPSSETESERWKTNGEAKLKNKFAMLSMWLQSRAVTHFYAKYCLSITFRMDRGWKSERKWRWILRSRARAGCGFDTPNLCLTVSHFLPPSSTFSPPRSPRSPRSVELLKILKNARNFLDQ